jgi:hypothetical protein
MTRRRAIVTIDAETDPFRWGRIPRPFAWGVHDGTRFRCFWDDQGGFVRWIRSAGVLAYAHNAGRFDLYQGLLQHLNPAKPVKIINGRIASIWIGTTEVRDSWLLIPKPLAAYRKDEIDYALFEREEREAHREEITAYLEGDCFYLWQLLQAFRAENPGVPLTLPQAAMRAFRRIERVPPPRSSASFDSIMRNWYYGGRCQTFAQGIIPGPIRALDIRSAYPWAMTLPHPWGQRYSVSKELPRGKWALRRSFAVLQARSFGALPRRTGVRLEFPKDGTLQTYLATGWEIEAGLETATLDIEKVLGCITFARTRNFRRYVAHYFRQKEEAENQGDDAARLVAKIMLNACYGKFAQNPDNHLSYTIYGLDDELPEDGKRYYQVGPYHIVGKPDEKGARRYDVSTAASITGCVRARLWRDLCRVQTPYYCDTDSILAAGLGSLRFGSALGEWVDEGHYSSAAIGGRKLYALRDRRGHFSKVATKGVQITGEEIERICRGETIVWKNDAPTYALGRDPYFIERTVRRTDGS